MGGRGAYSASGLLMEHEHGHASNVPLSIYAAASLNKGSAAGTTPEAAASRFREQLLGSHVEYSAYIDKAGYVHALASTGKEDSTGVIPLSRLAHEKGITTVIHNHPHFGSRMYGGTFSASDIEVAFKNYVETKGAINTIKATAKEGTYIAVVTKNIYNKRVTEDSIATAANRAETRAWRGKTFSTRKAMWQALHTETAKEMANLGINISFKPATNATKGKLVTQKIGEV